MASINIIKRNIVEKLNENGGIIFNEVKIPVLDVAITGDPERDVPDLYINYPSMQSTTLLHTKSGFNLSGSVSIPIFAKTNKHGDGVPLDVAELICGRLDNWKPADAVQSFLLQSISELAVIDKFRAAEMSYSWIGSGENRL